MIRWPMAFLLVGTFAVYASIEIADRVAGDCEAPVATVTSSVGATGQPGQTGSRGVR